MHILAKAFLAAALLLTPQSGESQPTEAGERMPPVECLADQPVKTQGYVSLGGIEQWVTIRGMACRNPVLLFVHGGPGNTMSPYSENIFSAWERHFTIVQWDQRGAGRTYERNAGSSLRPLSMDLMRQDGLELTTFLIAALKQQRIVLIGTSWGSALGVHMARARPSLFHAYVGVSQLVSYRANQQASYRALLNLAGGAGDTQTIEAMQALGPPPWANPRNFGIMRRAIRRYEAKSSLAAPAAWWVRAPLYASSEALAAYESGEDFSYIQFVGTSGNGMLSRIDLHRLGNRFTIPFFLVQGSEDLLTAPDVARAYFDSISAPEKRFITVPRAGHDPNAAMIDALRDLLMEEAPQWR